MTIFNGDAFLERTLRSRFREKENLFPKNFLCNSFDFEIAKRKLRVDVTSLQGLEQRTFSVRCSWFRVLVTPVV